MPLSHDLKVRIFPHQPLKQLGQLTSLQNMPAQALQPKGPDHEPELQRPESPTQTDLPVHVVDSGARVPVKFIKVEMLGLLFKTLFNI